MLALAASATLVVEASALFWLAFGVNPALETVTAVKEGARDLTLVLVAPWTLDAIHSAAQVPGGRVRSIPPTAIHHAGGRLVAVALGVIHALSGLVFLASGFYVTLAGAVAHGIQLARR